MQLNRRASLAVASAVVTSTVFASVASAGLPVPAYSSRPGAAYTVYLDLGGFAYTGMWNGQGTPGTNAAYDTDGDPTSFSAQDKANIAKVWAIVAGKYAGLSVNVTTVDPAVAAGKAATDAQRQTYYDNTVGVLHTVIGGNGGWDGGSGLGVSQLNVARNAYPGISANDAPHTNWIYSGLINGDTYYTGGGSAHENGHAFGLFHQSDYGLVVSSNGNDGEYDAGEPASAITASYSPIMGRPGRPDPHALAQRHEGRRRLPERHRDVPQQSQPDAHRRRRRPHPPDRHRARPHRLGRESQRGEGVHQHVEPGEPARRRQLHDGLFQVQHRRHGDQPRAQRGCRPRRRRRDRHRHHVRWQVRHPRRRWKRRRLVDARRKLAVLHLRRHAGGRFVLRAGPRLRRLRVAPRGGRGVLHLRRLLLHRQRRLRRPGAGDAGRRRVRRPRRWSSVAAARSPERSPHQTQEGHGRSRPWPFRFSGAGCHRLVRQPVSSDAAPGTGSSTNLWHPTSRSSDSAAERSARRNECSASRAERPACRAERLARRAERPGKPCRASSTPCRAFGKPCRASSKPCRALGKSCRASSTPCRASSTPCRAV